MQINFPNCQVKSHIFFLMAIVQFYCKMMNIHIFTSCMWFFFLWQQFNFIAYCRFTSRTWFFLMAAVSVSFSILAYLNLWSVCNAISWNLIIGQSFNVALACWNWLQHLWVVIVSNYKKCWLKKSLVEKSFFFAVPEKTQHCHWVNMMFCRL